MLNENTPYILLPENFVNVCAACYPGLSILSAFPDLTGRKVSHGYCRRHLEEFLASVKTFRKTFVKAGI